MELFVILMSLMMAVSSTKPALSISITSKLNSRIVKTRYGKIQGLTRTFINSTYLQSIDVYLGIPYATPPILSNRFSPTRAPSPWDGIKLMNSVSHVCPQKLPDITNEQKALERMPKGRYEYLKRLLPHLQNQSEDCLYLNIYGPAMVTHSLVRSILLVVDKIRALPNMGLRKISCEPFLRDSSYQMISDPCRNSPGISQLPPRSRSGFDWESLRRKSSLDSKRIPGQNPMSDDYRSF